MTIIMKIMENIFDTPLRIAQFQESIDLQINLKTDERCKK